MAGNRIRKSFIYRHLSSIKTTIYLLFILFFFFLIGTIFPQGVDPKKYAEAGGKFLFAAEYLGFLNIFETPLFFLAALLLAINTLICTLERTMGLKKSQAGQRTVGGEGPAAYTFPADIEISRFLEELRKLLKERGYTLRWKGQSEDTHALIFNRGINHSVTSIIFHGGIALCLVLFFYTHYYAFENYLTMYPGETKEVALPDGNSAPFQLKLNAFTTIYEDNPNIQFPGKAHLKIAAIISKPGQMAGFTLKEGAVAVSDWVSDISVLNADSEVERKKIEVNIPLRYRGFTFYQMGYDQEVELLVKGKKETLSPGKPFDGEKGVKLTLSAVKHGVLRKLDGTEDEIKPFVTLYKLKENTGKRQKDKIGEIIMGENKKIEGTSYRFAGFKEGSVLSYRVDPSVNILYYLSFFIIVLITARLYFRQSRLKIWVRHGMEENTLSFALTSRGGILLKQGEGSEQRKISDIFSELGLSE